MSSAPYASVYLEQPIFTSEGHPEEAATHASTYQEHEYEHPCDREEEEEQEEEEQEEEEQEEEEQEADKEDAPLLYTRKARKHLKTTVVELHLKITTSRAARFPIQQQRAHGRPKEDHTSCTLLLLTSTTTYPDFLANVEQRLQDPFYTRQPLLPTNNHLYILALLIGTHAQVGDLRIMINPATWPVVQKLLLKHRLDDGAFIEVLVCKDPFPGMEWSKSKSHMSVTGAGFRRAGRLSRGSATSQGLLRHVKVSEEVVSRRTS